MPKTTSPGGLSIKKKLLIAAGAFLFMVLVIASLFGDRGFIEIYQVGRQVEELENQMTELRRQRDDLRREIEELKTDPRAIREKARELGLAASDEKVILK
jgi:cell division protein FtsB